MMRLDYKRYELPLQQSQQTWRMTDNHQWNQLFLALADSNAVLPSLEACSAVFDFQNSHPGSGGLEPEA